MDKKLDACSSLFFAWTASHFQRNPEHLCFEEKKLQNSTFSWQAIQGKENFPHARKLQFDHQFDRFLLLSQANDVVSLCYFVLLFFGLFRLLFIYSVFQSSPKAG